MFYRKYNFEIISAGNICLSLCLELNDWDWTMKEENSVEYFSLFYATLLEITVKNVACLDFVNVTIALNSHAHEQKFSFILEFIKKMYLLLPFKSKNLRHLFMITWRSYSHFVHNIRHNNLNFHETIFFLNSNPGLLSILSITWCSYQFFYSILKKILTMY